MGETAEDQSEGVVVGIEPEIFEQNTSDKTTEPQLQIIKIGETSEVLAEETAINERTEKQLEETAIPELTELPIDETGDGEEYVTPEIYLDKVGNAAQSLFVFNKTLFNFSVGLAIESMIG